MFPANNQTTESSKPGRVPVVVENSKLNQLKALFGNDKCSCLVFSNGIRNNRLLRFEEALQLFKGYRLWPLEVRIPGVFPLDLFLLFLEGSLGFRDLSSQG